jgi:hypothetical protein
VRASCFPALAADQRIDAVENTFEAIVEDGIEVIGVVVELPGGDHAVDGGKVCWVSEFGEESRRRCVTAARLRGPRRCRC